MSAQERRPSAQSVSAAAAGSEAETPSGPTPPREGDLLRALRNLGAAVADAGAALLLSGERMRRAEGIDRLELAVSVPLDEALRWNARRLATAFQTLRDDLRVDVALSGLETTDPLPAATLRADASPEETLTEFLIASRALTAAHGEEATVDLRLAVGKSGALALVSRLLGQRREYLGTAEALAETKLMVWYHGAGFEGLTELRAFADWERLGLARTSGRTVVTLCDASGYLAGPALEIIGARIPTTPRWLLLSRAAWRQFTEHAEAVRRLRDEESMWIGGPRVITPEHLRLVERDAGLEPLAAALGRLRAGVAAAYLAASVHETEDDLLLRFSGERPATCRLFATNSTGASQPLSGALGRFAAWAFEHGSADKLLIARECLARELPAGAEAPLAQVDAAAGPALEAARANLALYLRGRSQEYFQAREQAAETVSAYTLGVRRSVSDLTSEVVNNVFATVGLLVGVVIAGLIQPRASLPVQRLGVGLYTIYVVFILWFLLRARWERYQLERAEVGRRLDDMSELSASEGAGLRAQAGAANAYFERYFVLAWRIYAALGGLGVVYFLLLLTPLASHVALPHAR